MKVDSEAKFQGLKLLPNEIFIFVIAKLRNIEFVPAKELFYLYLGEKRDRAALVGLPPPALGPQMFVNNRMIKY